MNRIETRKPAEQGRTFLLAIAGLGVGLWCLLSHEWDDEAKYYVPSRFTQSGEIREGRGINRNRQLVGVGFLAIGFYCSYCLIRKRSPFFAAYDFEPEVIHQVMPEMPAALNARSVGGRATVEFVISREGDVTEAKIFYATHPEFGAAALNAIKQWKFRPALKGNIPKACPVRLPVEFTPEGLRNLSQHSFRTGNY